MDATLTTSMLDDLRWIEEDLFDQAEGILTSRIIEAGLRLGLTIDQAWDAYIGADEDHDLYVEVLTDIRAGLIDEVYTDFANRI